MTVALAMPFLKQAREVVVVAVGPQHMPEPGPTGEDARSLEGHGLKVTLRSAFGRDKPMGESFLKEATAAGADLLLKGAYTRSRIRQMIFGGATRPHHHGSQDPGDHGALRRRVVLVSEAPRDDAARGAGEIGMRSVRWDRTAVLWAGVAVFGLISPAVAQAPPYPPPPPPYGAVPAPRLSGEAGDIAACLCLRQAVDVFGADMAAKQRSRDEINAELSRLDTAAATRARRGGRQRSGSGRTVPPAARTTRTNSAFRRSSGPRHRRSEQRDHALQCACQRIQRAVLQPAARPGAAQPASRRRCPAHRPTDLDFRPAESGTHFSAAQAAG